MNKKQNRILFQYPRKSVRKTGIAYNVRVYAMFATGIMCLRITSGKYGCSEEEARRRTEPHIGS